MRGTAVALKDEYDEVHVSSIEVLEANVAAMRDAFNEFRNDVRAGLANIHDEIKSLREKSDKNFERLSTKIDGSNAPIDATNQEVAQLTKTVIRTESKLSALAWIGGGIGGLIALVTTLNKIFHWY